MSAPARTLGATVAQVATLVVLAAFVADVVGDQADNVVGPLKVVVMVAAVLAAGACYQTWGGLDERTPPLHVAALTGLLGGAMIAAAVFAAPDGGDPVFANRTFGLLGTVSLVVSAVAIGWWRAGVRRTGSQ